jgi:hypothetical protein
VALLSRVRPFPAAIAVTLLALGIGSWIASDNVASGHALWAIPRDYVASSRRRARSTP